MYNPATYYSEFKQAYGMWYDLVALHPEYSVTGSGSQKLIGTQSDFYSGKAAMIPYAQWAELELENSYGGPLDFDIAMMPTPKATAASDAVNYLVGLGDSMIVPENSPNQDLATQFLAFMATDGACETFVDKSHGAFLAFDYSDIDLSALEAQSPYIKSIHDKLTATENFNLVSTNPITIYNVNSVMPWVANKYYYSVAVQSPADYTPDKVATEIYNTAKSSWPAWIRTAGLRD